MYELSTMGGGVIYTAICGGKDDLQEPEHVIHGVKYVCFTDDPNLRSETWEIRQLEWRHADPTRTARRPKLLPHRHLKGFEWSFWIDGNISITGDLEEFLSRHLALSPFMAFRQFQRTCAYQVVDACIRLNKDDPAVLLAQAARYRKLCMPEGLPVVGSCIMLRRHNEPDVMNLMELWWREVKRHSRRDQMSLPYVLWRNPNEFRFFYDGERPYWNELPFITRRKHLIKASHPW